MVIETKAKFHPELTYLDTNNFYGRVMLFMALI